MYETFYDLESNPFEPKPDPAFLWLGEKHKEALSILRYGILENKGFLLLTGEAGTGKTTLLNGLTEGLKDDVEWAMISDPALERLDFYNKIATGFGLRRQFTSKVQFLIQFSQFLYKAHDDNKRVVLIIDDCHQLSQEMLEELRLLANIEKSDVKLINMFFIGQPVFNEMLVKEKNKAVRQRLALKANISPLDAAEIGDYVRHRLKVSMAVEKIFTGKAIKQIYKYSQGVPKRINIICEHALQAGAVLGKKAIDHRLIKECIASLELSGSPGQDGLKELSMEQKRFNRFDKNIVSAKGVPLNISGFSVGDEKRGRGLLYTLLFLAVASVGLYFVTNQAGNGVDKGEMIVASVVKATSSPVTKFLGKNDSVINARKAAELKSAILEKAYSGEVQQDLEPTAVEAVSGRIESDVVVTAQEKASVSMARIVTLEPTKETITVLPEVQYVSKKVVPLEQAVVVIKEGEKKKNHFTVSKKEVEPSVAIEQPAMEPVKIILGLQPNSLNLTRRARKNFEKFVETLLLYPGARVVVRGYVSSNNDSLENVRLSEQRAMGVGQLLEKYGVDPAVITVKGMGIQNPIATNSSSAGRRMNRRVEIEVLSDGV